LVRRYRPYDPPQGPLERNDPLPTEVWLWKWVAIFVGLAALGAIFG
jgi:hypothetical protein